MDDTSSVSCGVAGVGYLGQHHARLYQALPNCKLAGIYDPDSVRAQAISHRYGCQVFDSLTELGQACDAVSIVSPTDHHCDLALKLLDEGCHLLIEKPLCVSLDEAELILAKSKATSRIVQVGHIEHFNPVMSFLENAVDQPRYIVADRLAPFNPRGTEVGAVLDLMIHDIGIILQLVRSTIKSIDSVGVCVLSKSEDIANTRICFANGCVANINTSRVSEKKVREIRVFQSGAYLSLDFMNQAGHLIQHKQEQLEREEIPIEKGEPLMLELASFLECVTRSQSPKVDAHLGKSALEVALTITQQINSQMAESI